VVLQDSQDGGVVYLRVGEYTADLRGPAGGAEPLLAVK
jgi:hypothetical protein